MSEPSFVPLEFQEVPVEVMRRRADEMLREMSLRRTTRQFSTRPVPRDLVEKAVAVAGTAPSGANLQPWTFVVIEDAETKRRIREAAEEEERRNYAERMAPEWLEVLRPLGTDDVKPHLTDAPYVVVLFKHVTREAPGGKRAPTYYPAESVGIAAGFFIAALHHIGLVTLTHTPSPMGFLSKILGRPAHEKPFLVMPVGYPAPAAKVPDIGRKALEEILVWR
jgi:nitroreductase